MENIFYPIEFRIKEEIGSDAKPYRSWWNNITEEWKYWNSQAWVFSDIYLYILLHFKMQLNT
jgi:hypothetical protein